MRVCCLEDEIGLGYSLFTGVVVHRTNAFGQVFRIGRKYAIRFKARGKQLKESAFAVDCMCMKFLKRGMFECAFIQ